MQFPYDGARFAYYCSSGSAIKCGLVHLCATCYRLEFENGLTSYIVFKFIGGGGKPILTKQGPRSSGCSLEFLGDTYTRLQDAS